MIRGSHRDGGSLLRIEQLMVCFLDGSVTVFDIQMCTSRVNIFCKVGAAVMSNDTVTGHCADCSFYRRHLLKCGCLIGILFAAAAAGFVTFAKSNAKALLTAELSKAHCALRGGMRLLRKPLPCLQPVQVLQNTARSLSVLRNIHRPLSERNCNHFSQTVRFQSTDFWR